jgi:hypothetical protein
MSLCFVAGTALCPASLKQARNLDDLDPMSIRPAFALRLPASLLLLGLAGCGSVLTESTADVAGIAGAGAANAITSSAAVATGIGLGVQSAASAGLHYVERDVHRIEQDRIAAAAGALPVGVVGRWSVRHWVPIENDEHGEVVVSRVLGADSITCKEIVFSVEHPTKKETQRSFYTATVCQDGTTWRWATAEPATARWSTFQ